jgi:hypothetical protein
MARTAGHLGDSPHTADGGQHRPPRKQREPEAATVVLTPKGQRRLAARAAWLATGPIPRFAHYLDDPDQDGWASAEYGHDVSELAFLTRILQRAITTDQLAPENPGIVEATRWQSSSPTATPSGSWWPARSRPHLTI